MIKKFKDWLGIEGVKVILAVTEELYPGKNVLNGQVRLTSKTDQWIESLNFKLIEKYTRGRRKSKLIDEYEIGKMTLTLNREIQGETFIELPFSLPYILVNSPIEDFGNKNILFKGLSKVAKLAKNAKSEFYVLCEAKVKGNALSPYHKLQLA